MGGSWGLGAALFMQWMPEAAGKALPKPPSQGAGGRGATESD